MDRSPSPDPQGRKGKRSEGHRRASFRPSVGESSGDKIKASEEAKGAKESEKYKRRKLKHHDEVSEENKRKYEIWSGFNADTREIGEIIHQNFSAVPRADLEKANKLLNSFRDLPLISNASVDQLAELKRQSEQMRDYFRKWYKDIIRSRFEANIKEIIEIAHQNPSAVPSDDLKKCNDLAQSFNGLLERPEANVNQLENYERQSKRWRDHFHKQYKDIIWPGLYANIKEIHTIIHQTLSMVSKGDVKEFHALLKSVRDLPEANVNQLAERERQSEQMRDDFREKYEGKYFPEASDIDSDSDLNEAEQSFKINKAVVRLERIDKEREEFVRDARRLSRSYSKAMNMLRTAMYTLKQIHDLVEFGKVRYANNPDLLRYFEGNSLDFASHTAKGLDEAERQLLAHQKFAYQKRLNHWVEHYKSCLKLNERVPPLKTGISSATRSFVGPIDAYNRDRAFLESKFSDLNTKIETYNYEHPHLHENFKRGPFFDYTLPPKIPHLLLPLNEALEVKPWVDYGEMYRTWEPIRPGHSPEELEQIFSRDSAKWVWDKDGSYVLDWTVGYDPPAGSSSGPPPSK